MGEMAGRLSPSEVATLLEATSAEIQAEVRALPAALATWHPEPGEWCVNQVLGHAIETERLGFAGRIRLILSANEPILPAHDQVELARARDDCERVTADLLAEFTALRVDSIALVRGLSDADLKRGGEHERVGYLRVEDLLQEWLHHDRKHFRQMLANVQSAVWPYMANSQKFP